MNHALQWSDSIDFSELHDEITFLLWLYSTWKMLKAQNCAENMLNQSSEAINSGNAYGQKPIQPLLCSLVHRDFNYIITNFSPWNPFSCFMVFSFWIQCRPYPYEIKGSLAVFSDRTLVFITENIDNFFKSPFQKLTIVQWIRYKQHIIMPLLLCAALCYRLLTHSHSLFLKWCKFICPFCLHAGLFQ